MEEELEILLKLQELDIEISGLRSEHDAIPVRIGELEQNYEQLKQELEKQESAHKAAKLTSRDAESKIALLDSSATKFKQHLTTVKTNREYSALLTEIEAVKREKDELEDRVLKKMDETEKTAVQIEENRARLAESGKACGKDREELAKRMKELEGEMAVRVQKRSNLTIRISQPLLSLYERIMRSRIRLAVVPLHNGSCGGCYAMIPLQKVADIRKADRIHTCDNCGRILYVLKGEGK
jgi:uncharacterized protein